MMKGELSGPEAWLGLACLAKGWGGMFCQNANYLQVRFHCKSNERRLMALDGPVRTEKTKFGTRMLTGMYRKGREGDG